MAIYAISDLHLSFGENKPMSIFGDNWIQHEEKIKQDWIKKVKKDDLVLLSGDFSWAMYLSDTQLDFEYLTGLPGNKLLLKGNHDYWWTTLTRMRQYLKEKNFEQIDFLYNNSYEKDGYIIAGTRGWSVIDEQADLKILKRENLRLELSIQDGIRKYGTNKPIIVCMHYPPFSKNRNAEVDFIQTMKQYPVKKCIYGHLHGPSHKDAFEGIKDGIEFKMVSCDYTGFKLVKL